MAIQEDCNGGSYEEDDTFFVMALSVSFYVLVIYQLISYMFECFIVSNCYYFYPNPILRRPVI